MVLASKLKRPDTIHHKKRTGRHHKHTKPYHKAYWPYLPILAVIGLGFVLNAIWPQPGAGVLAYATSMNATDLLQATNGERQTAGQQSLTINTKLTSAAQAKADDMAARGYWSHITPDGLEPWHFVKLAGYTYQAAGENLAYGFLTSEAAVIGWMNSPGHKANILNAGYREVGFGIANASQYQGDGPETIVVAMYGTPVAPAVAAQPATAPEAAPAPPEAAAAPAPQQGAPAPSAATLDVVTSPAQDKPAPGTTAGLLPEGGTSRQVSRLELVANVSPANIVALTLILATATGIFILRHIIFWRRVILHSETFVIRHWKADLVLVGFIVIGALVTRSAGTIL